MTILLARHGETDDNIEPIRIQGRRDTPLNDTGRAQAGELAERVAGEGIASLWSSQLSRARETAEIVGARLGLEPVIDERLAEGDRGELEGRYWRDVAREDPELYAAWRRAGEAFRFPGGESLREQMERTLAALADVRAAGPLPGAERICASHICLPISALLSEEQAEHVIVWLRSALDRQSH